MKLKKLLAGYIEPKTDPGQIVVALVAGLAAGVVASLLFAPAKGRDTRDRISGAARGMKERAGEEWTKLKNRLMDNAEEEAVKAVKSIPRKAAKVIKKTKPVARVIAKQA